MINSLDLLYVGLDTPFYIYHMFIFLYFGMLIVYTAFNIYGMLIVYTVSDLWHICYLYLEHAYCFYDI